MATVEIDELVDQPIRPLIAADLAAMPEELPSGPVDFELENGRFVLMSPTGRRHGSLQSRIARALIEQGEDPGHGEAYSETGIILSRNPDSVAGPDAMFVTNRSMPIRESAEGYLETIPELVVEIRSKNDTHAYLNRKTAAYLRVGVQLVWIVDPDAMTVTEHRPQASEKALGKGDVLNCGDIIPGFRLPLSELFGK
jgi:Uma2 family endonuclease